MERISRVYGLVEDVSNLVQRFDDLDHQLYLGWREELEDALVNLSFRSEFETFTRRIHRTLLVNLEFCSNALSERCPEPTVDAEKLNGLSQFTLELVRAIPQAQLDPASERYFQDYLRVIRRSIENYTLTGASGLQGALDRCTGTLVTQRQVSLPSRENPIGKKFWSLINQMAKALVCPQQGGETEWSTRHQCVARATGGDQAT